MDECKPLLDGGGGPRHFSFKPGQWVDFFAPGVDKPGGYSIASSPAQLAGLAPGAYTRSYSRST